MEGRRLGFKQTNTYGEYIFSSDFSLTNFRTLSKRVGPGIIFGLLAGTDSARRIFRTCNDIRISEPFQFQLLSHKLLYPEKVEGKKGKGLRGRWFCSPFNIQAILDQLVRNTEHVL